MIIPCYNYSMEKNPLFCFKHKIDGIINIQSIKCSEDKCNKRPNFNFSTEKKAIYCSEHKKDNMIDIIHPKCYENTCFKIPIYNYLTEKNGLYCFEHKLAEMINVTSKKCRKKKCITNAIFGLPDKFPIYCKSHKEPNMINLILENKCSILDCNNEFDVKFNNDKYCLKHCPDNNMEISIKKLCKYCDLTEESKYICKNCEKIKNKKEWGIIRYIRKEISNPFIYNSSKMLQGCSKKRPYVYFELNKHCVIVEIDEYQHNTYQDICECSRLNEIVNGIGGKSVIIIRFNPDIIKNNGIKINIKQIDRLNLLIDTIKNELDNNYDKFLVKIIQICYNDNYLIYQRIKEEDITSLVCI